MNYIAFKESLEDFANFVEYWKKETVRFEIEAEKVNHGWIFNREKGPLAGLILRFEEGTEWVMGRDPDVVGLVLEDPMVSRKHVICRLTAEGYILENLSAVIRNSKWNDHLRARPPERRRYHPDRHTFFRFSENSQNLKNLLLLFRRIG